VQPSDDRLDRELHRTRDRLHSLESRVAGIEMALRFVRESLDELAPTVMSLQVQDAIAEGIAEKLSTREQSAARTWGLRVAVSGAVIAGAAAIIDLVRLVTG
jgi:hypothetical protein